MGTNPGVYTAPAKRPTPNVATVGIPYAVYDYDETPSPWFFTPTRERSLKRGIFTAHITIVDRGYKASGNTADVAWSSGKICLEEPFTVSGSVINYKLNFVPSSPTGGTASIGGAGLSVVAIGGGTYTIEGADTDTPRIVLTQSTVGHSPVGSRTGSGTIYINLVPLEGSECGGG